MREELLECRHAYRADAFATGQPGDGVLELHRERLLGLGADDARLGGHVGAQAAAPVNSA